MKRFDPFNIDPELNRLRMAHHEAGHAVVTWAHGIALREVSVGRKDGYSDRAELNDQLYARMGASEALRALAEIAAAGGCAQRRWLSDTGCTGCEHDFPQIRTCLDPLDDHLPKLCKTLTVDDVIAAADLLVEKHWTRIERLAEELLKRGTIAGDEVARIIERT